MYHRVINSAAVKKAKVSLECVGGELGSTAQSNWTNTAFNRLESTYYGPSIHYTHDNINFVVLDPAIDSQFDFVIQL